VVERYKRIPPRRLFRFTHGVACFQLWTTFTVPDHSLEGWTMTTGFLFWFLMILWLLFGLYWHWPDNARSGPLAFGPLGGNLLLFILLFLVGWKLFGFPIQG